MHHPDLYQLTEKYFKAYLLVCVNLIEIPRRNYLVMAILHCSKIYGKLFYETYFYFGKHFNRHTIRIILHTPEFLQILSFADSIARIVDHEYFIIQLDRCEQSFAFRIGQKGG